MLATLTEPGREGVSTLWKGTESPNITFTPAHVRLHQHIYVYTNITEGQVLATLTEPGKEGVSTLWMGDEPPNITFTPAHIRLHQHTYVYTSTYTFTPAHMCGACERGRRPRSGLSCVRRLHQHYGGTSARDTD